ncbi:max-binding protein MNT [Pangasianodon hypophthalmus]|uniref:max-binding protein MNT n=1 Tax=Pangasianodon hypophthalmus TaxID=310915 RepID=UPI002307F5EE|nr:max-binding protein MNT [Pangasianodon hypophthalmus]
MSIETLLEAAKFLELQAQQQQKTREENELRERLRLEQEAGKQRAEAPSCIQATHDNHLSSREESSPERNHAPPSALSSPPPPPPPPLSAPSIPITVIPIPVVSSNPIPSPSSPHLSVPQKDTHSPPSQHVLPQRAALPPQTNGPKLPQPLQPYPSSIVRASQHALLPQPANTPAQPSLMAKTSPPDDHRGLDGKKRPGGAGTREVHNKLEKNRRAHLKECFETLKKNIPHVDEKKTSNLSVLRSALRYIQTLKRKEKEYEHEMERLAREKISTQQRLAELKNELSQWMDMMEVERLLRQTVQPEDDQASTSTASEGEDNMDEDIDEEGVLTSPCSLPRVPQPELRKPSPSLPQTLSVPSKPSQPLPTATVSSASAFASAQPSSPSLSLPPAAVTQQPQAMVAPQSLAYGHIVAAPSIQPTVITHASSHASVIQAVNHVTQTGTKHIAHIAPSSTSSPSSSTSAIQLAPGPQTIGHITVHPVTHLPTLYPQPVTISHTLSHGQANGAPTLAKQTPVGHQVLAHHPQLVGQTVLNPVTMVTMPSFPVSTLKLA